MSRLWITFIIATSTHCIALDPAYWNCDESPYLTRNLTDEPSCVDNTEACSLLLNQPEELILWGRSCDSEYPLTITDVRLEPPSAEWQLVPSSWSNQDISVSLTPRETGVATLYLEYAWQGGFREFQTELRFSAATDR